MKKIILLMPLVLGLFACNDETMNQDTENEKASVEQVQNDKELSKAEQSEWAVDERIQEPTEDSTCYMCNMKVYTRDDEMGVFSAQAILEDSSVVFYDDIGCLLNDEYVNNVENEKFVRDFYTLNWFNVEEATIVKTTLKSPMNWGYIFFKYEEDAQVYVSEHNDAKITPLDQVREEGIERHKQKEAHGGGHHHSNEGHKGNVNNESNMHDDQSSKGHDE